MPRPRLWLLVTVLAAPLPWVPGIAAASTPVLAAFEPSHADEPHGGQVLEHAEHAEPGNDVEHHADEHGGAIRWVSPILGNEGKTGVIWLLINFVVLMWVLNRLLFAPLRQRQATQHARVKTELLEATTAREEAEAVIGEYRGRMERLDAEIAELLAHAKARAEADRAQIIADAQREAERIRNAAQAAAERDAEATRRAIEDDVLDRAIAKAEELLRERIRPADQHRLVEDYVQRLGGVDLSGGVA